MVQCAIKRPMASTLQHTASLPKGICYEVLDIAPLDGVHWCPMEPDTEEGAYVSTILLQVLQCALQCCDRVVAEWPVLDGLVAQQQVAVAAAGGRVAMKGQQVFLEGSNSLMHQDTQGPCHPSKVALQQAQYFCCSGPSAVHV
jgi:hypothetical protein